MPRREVLVAEPGAISRTADDVAAEVGGLMAGVAAGGDGVERFDEVS